MAGDVVRVAESLPASRGASARGRYPPPLPPPQQGLSPGRKPFASQLSVMSSDAPLKVAATTACAAPQAAAPLRQAQPRAAQQGAARQAPQLAPLPELDAETSPLAAGLAQLSPYSSWRSSSSGAPPGQHRSSSSSSCESGQGLGLSAGSGCCVGRAHLSSGRGAAAQAEALPGPVPIVSSQITYMPLGHQAGKWAAAPRACPPPAGAGSSVAAVGILSRSTAAALLGGRQRPSPAGAVGGRGGAPADSPERTASRDSAELAPALAYRPWTAVRRLIDEVGRQAGGAPAALPQHAQASPARYTASQAAGSASVDAAPPLQPEAPRQARAWAAQGSEVFSPLFHNAAAQLLGQRGPLAADGAGAARQQAAPPDGRGAHRQCPCSPGNVSFSGSSSGYS